MEFRLRIYARWELDVLDQSNQLLLADKALEGIARLGSSIARPTQSFFQSIQSKVETSTFPLNAPSLRSFTNSGILPCPSLTSTRARNWSRCRRLSSLSADT